MHERCERENKCFWCMQHSYEVMYRTLVHPSQALQHILIPMFTVTCEEGRGDEVRGLQNVVMLCVVRGACVCVCELAHAHVHMCASS